MKVIFVIQGEGRGHLTQALALKQMLLHEGHEVVKVLVGKSKNRVIPEFFQNKIGTPIEVLTVRISCRLRTTASSISCAPWLTIRSWFPVIFQVSI